MQNKYKIFVIDDEAIILKSCSNVLTENGYEVATAQSSRIALERIKEELFDLIILDLKMPGIDGLQLLRIIKNIKPNIEVIIITGYSSIENAIETMKLGAADYLQKPFTPDELSIRVKNVLDKKKLIQENITLRKELEEKFKFSNIIGKSKQMQAIFQIIEKIARTDSTVIIYGESGTGKELVAKAIHYNSSRKEKQFISIDCSTLTESLLESELFGHIKGSFTGAIATKPGLFEIADGGTIFLDEISNITPMIQAKLLRVLQEKEIKPVGSTEIKKVDVRIIAATNKLLEELVKEGKFREDLFYRLNVVPIHLPSLKERKGDIPFLVKYFLEKFTNKYKKDIRNISEEVLKIFESYNWPGNVRELENLIERLVILVDEKTIKVEHLPLYISGINATYQFKIPQDSYELKKLKKQIRLEAVKNIEKLFVTEALKNNNWNITKAAKSVKMKRQNFQTLIKKYQIKL